MKAAIYIRVSTPGQAINGESLDMQKERLIEYVKAHDWELFKTYEDGGFSGKDTDRPGFLLTQFLKGLKRSLINKVYHLYVQFLSIFSNGTI